MAFPLSQSTHIRVFRVYSLKRCCLLCKRGTLKMSLHFKFAANLRRKCADFGSIAEVCRGVGINRQQFNKYLAGNSIPNALTLRKICIFLDIQEQSLFFDEEAGVVNSNGSRELPGFLHGGFPDFSRQPENILTFMSRICPRAVTTATFHYITFRECWCEVLSLFGKKENKRIFFALVSISFVGKSVKATGKGQTQRSYFCEREGSLFFRV